MAGRRAPATPWQGTEMKGAGETEEMGGTEGMERIWGGSGGGRGGEGEGKEGGRRGEERGWGRCRWIGERGRRWAMLMGRRVGRSVLRESDWWQLHDGKSGLMLRRLPASGMNIRSCTSTEVSRDECTVAGVGFICTYVRTQNVENIGNPRKGAWAGPRKRCDGEISLGTPIDRWRSN